MEKEEKVIGIEDLGEFGLIDRITEKIKTYNSYLELIFTNRNLKYLEIKIQTPHQFSVADHSSPHGAH